MTATTCPSFNGSQELLAQGHAGEKDDGLRAGSGVERDPGGWQGVFVDLASPLQDMQTGRGDCAASLLSAIAVSEQYLTVAVEEIRRAKLSQFRREALHDRQPFADRGRFMSPQEPQSIQQQAERDFRIRLPDWDETSFGSVERLVDVREHSVMGEDVHPPAQFSDEGLRVREADAATRRVPNVRDDEPAVGSAGFESVLKPWIAPGRLWLAHDADIAAVVAHDAPPVGERTARRPAVSETAEGKRNTGQ